MSWNTLPKLLPLWHDVTINEERGKNLQKNFGRHLYPDHGGAGVDISVINDAIKCEELKASTNFSNYGADMPALPYLPPNRVESLFDPCFEKLHRRREKQKKFCATLPILHSKMKSAPAFRKAVLSAQKELSNKKKISIPQSVVNLAKLFPKKNFPADCARWEYLCGCLDVISSSSSSHYLLHPLGAKLSLLALTPLQENVEGQKVVEPNTKDRVKIQIKGGKIFQICADSNSGTCCVRKRRNYHFVALKDFKEGNIKNYNIESYSYKEPISCVKLSPFVPGEHIVSLKSGKLYLKNAELKKTVWQLDNPLSHSDRCVDSWWNCDFGSHPRSVLYSDRQSLCCLDTRSKERVALSLFSSTNPFLVKSELFTVTKRLCSTPFQHLVASDFHLFICDERYPNQPVMSWNHMLESLPLYCDVKQCQWQGDSYEYATILASQETADIASFHFNSKTSRIQPHSLCQPLHLSSPNDFAHMLNFNCIYASDVVMKRSSFPLIGICAIPHSNSNGYTVLQTTSVGDVFYQQFLPNVAAEKSYRVGFGCPPVSLDTILPQVSSWMKAVSKLCKRKKKEKITRVNINKDAFLSGVSEKLKLVNCSICQQGTIVPQLETSPIDTCPRCGINVEYGQQMMKCAEKATLLGGRFSMDDSSSHINDFLNLDLSSYSDPLSTRFFDVWGNTNFENGNIAVDTSSPFINGDTSLGESSSSPLKRKSVSFSLSQPVGTDSQWSIDDIIPPSQDLSISSNYGSRKDIVNPKRRKLISSSLGF